MNYHSAFRAVVYSVIVTLLLSSCCKVYDDLSSCPQGLVLRLNSVTPCGAELCLKDMKNVEIQIYDQSKSLVATYHESDLKITERNEVKVPFHKAGTYTVAVWGIENMNDYARSNVASMAYKRSKDVQLGSLSKLYYGNAKDYKITDPALSGSQIDTLDVNILPYNYEIYFSLWGLQKNSEYSIEISDNHAAYDFFGRVKPTPIRYKRQAYENPDESYKARFETLRLIRNGATNIQLKDKEGKVFFEASLEELLKTIERANRVSINLDCLHRLDISLRPTDDTFTVFSVRINQWNAVFRRVVLEA